MDRAQPPSSNLMDIHNRLIADVLTRYRTLMMLATIQAEGDRNNATPEAVAVTGISMKMEFDGLYSSIKELLALSRRIKELWVFGPLGDGDPGRREKEAQVARHVDRVEALIGGFEAAKFEALAGENGGSWRARTEASESVPVMSGAAFP
ncbi:surfeit locus protein 5 subunit 22 of mediator complex domain-containing protein [Ophiocordyceps camponoti-floridani]|uniref:Surfeit locus protein 5 subunit 22 of mediator complex domain-containing protein n=1 Tax=Ophiocordyceps camponoti-floridani TaxID=2030778 RepID=A0A8H4Q0G7_9HYPO|nr:surfeit locus protein 5 subunit 22 of mediator complex domain-containing protein [Ophiocordyceps camponoti-floridani]